MDLKEIGCEDVNCLVIGSSGNLLKLSDYKLLKKDSAPSSWTVI